MTDHTTPEPTEPDNPAAYALARHIADHPVSTIQAAFRYLNAPLAFELHEPAAAPVVPPATGQDPDCLFCHTDTPDNRVIARSGTCYARADNYPASKGHTEVVPSRHVESALDLTDQEITDAWRLLRQLAAQGDADGWTIGINEGRAAGRTVDHVHIHLIPRRFGDVPDPRGGVRNVLPGQDPDRWAAPAAPATGQDAALTASERQFLRFALDLAFDRMVSDDGFTDEDEAALEKLRRMAGETAATETPDVPVHACPEDGSGLTGCCQRTPFELAADRMTEDPAEVTCTGTQPAGGQQ